MAIEIKGREIQLDNEVLITRGNRGYAFPRKVPSLETKTQISPERYALIMDGKFPDFSSRRAILMEQANNGLPSEKAIISALKGGLTVPSTSPFMRHYIDANDALSGKGVLYDASGNLIENTRLTNYVNALNSRYWVNLNAKFVEGQGFLDLDLETITGINPDNTPIFSRAPLEDCLEDDCYIDLDSLNSQGFPTKKSTFKDYIPGRVIMFYRPQKNKNAGFSADSGGAGLGCGRNPQYSNPALGVPVCAEGVQNF